MKIIKSSFHYSPFGLISVISLFVYNDFTNLVISGEVGLSIYLVVMFAGAFPRESRVSKRLRSVRKEYSIWGFVALLPHFILFLIDFINGSYSWEVFGIIAAGIMIPLFITSFQKYKRMMKIQDWQKLQKFSYLVYTLIFVHLLLSSSPDHQVYYIFVFTAYSILKIMYYVLKDKVWLRRGLAAMILAITIISAHSIITTETAYFPLLYGESDSNLLASDADMIDGVYTGTAVGFTGEDVIVKVTITNGEISDIVLVDCACTPPSRGMDYATAALSIVNSVIRLQTTNIDAISGATTTSHSVIEAIEDALKQSIQ